MHEQLARIESGMNRVEGKAAETAEFMRRMMRVVSAEVTDCPSLFTLTQDRPTGDRRLRFYQHHYRLTLWCEHPGYWHPWEPASYELDPQDLAGVDLAEIRGQLTSAEGEALRAIRAVVFEHDRLRTFGGLRRTQAPSGDFLWVCKDHYREYDPGLPTVP